MFRILIYVVLAYIVWKIVRIFFSVRQVKYRKPEQTVEFPQDKSYKNIEDADFEDITPDSDKPS